MQLCISATAGISIAGMIETFLFLYEWRLTKLTGGNYGAGHHVWSISLSDLEETYYVRLKLFDLT